METIKVSLLAGAGSLAIVAAGSLWWLAPFVMYLAIVVYDHTTPDEDHVRRYLTAGTARRLLVDSAMTAYRDARLLLPDSKAEAVNAPEIVHNPSGIISGPQPERQQTAAPDRPRWLAAVNDEPDRAPHTLIIGPTGSGKTTMACAALGARPDRTVVLSPKVNAGNWRGAEVATLDDDGTYEPLSRALEELEQEKRERIVTLRKRGADALAPLTIVLDETPELVRFVPKAGDFIGSMSSIGRELKMRLVVLSTSSRVKDLGIEGRGAALENFIRVDLDRDRRATLNDGIRSIAVSTKEVQAQAKAAHLRPWHGNALPEVVTHAKQLPLPTPEPDDLLASLFATMSPERAARLQSVTVGRAGGDVTVNVQQVAPVTQRVKRREGAINMQDRARRLRRKAYYEQAAREGVSFTRAYADAPGGEKGNYNEAGQWYRSEKAKTAS